MTILDCTAENQHSLLCSLKNENDSTIHLNSSEIFGVIYDSFYIDKCPSLNNLENAEENKFASESIDEQILAEHHLIDTSELDKKCSH